MACKLENIILLYLRISQRCHWGFKLPGRWHCCVEWVVPGISKGLVAIMFVDCLPLKVKMTWYYNTCETTHPMTHHVPGHLNPWVMIRASRTSRTVLYWFVAKKVLHLPNKTTWIQVWVKQTYTTPRIYGFIRSCSVCHGIWTVWNIHFHVLYCLMHCLSAIIFSLLSLLQSIMVAH
jgi:hypothetical protein